MFNVLPNIFKKEIKNAYRLHLTMVILISILFLQISFLIFISPTWVSSYFREKELESQLKSLSNTESYQDLTNVSASITLTNAKLKALTTNLQYVEVVPLLKSILANKNSGIKIDQIYYSSVSAASSTIALSGQATSRETLIKFTDLLNQSKAFGMVDLPISNLAKDKNIDFSINLKI